ncbi:MAG: rhodanese-like domain-containing protein [Thermodesulfobacteriota bacterium]
MSRLRAALVPALVQALVLFGLAAGAAFLVNASHPGGLSWGPAPLPPAAVQDAPAEGEPPAVDLAEALALHGQGAVFLDARYPGDYAAGHIPGARSVPPDMFADQVEALLADGPKDRPLVAYCHDPVCPLARELAENLMMLGYSGVKVFAGGLAEWAAAGNPEVEGEAP